MCEDLSNVDGTIPWAEFPNWIQRRKPTDHQYFSLCLLTVNALWPIAPRSYSYRSLAMMDYSLKLRIDMNPFLPKLLLFYNYFMCTIVLPTYISMHCVHVWSLQRAKEGIPFPGLELSRTVPVMWLLKIKPESTGRTASALTSEPSPQNFKFLLDRCFITATGKVTVTAS